MIQIQAIIQPFMLQDVLHVLAPMDSLPGLTISEVRGWGRTRATDAKERVHEAGHMFAPKIKIEIVLEDDAADAVAAAIASAAATGRAGDGKIFIHPIDRVISIRQSGADLEEPDGE